MKKTDIYFTFKEKKKGRKVDELEFLIFKNVVTDENTTQHKSETYDLFHNQPDSVDLSNKELFIHEQLIAIGFTDSDAKLIIKDPFQYIKDPVILEEIKKKNQPKEEYIQEKIDYYTFEKENKKPQPLF